MSATARSDLQGLRVISFESRRAKEMAELIRRYGGEPILAPSMRELPLGENHAACDLLPQLESGAIALMVLMTGVGTRALNDAWLTKYSQDRIVSALRQTCLVARGPKPSAVLKELGLMPAISVPEPNTWREVLAALNPLDLSGKRVAVQEYGIANPAFIAGLQERGAIVQTVQVYRWALPEDVEPLRRAIQRIIDGEADIALFTNGTQVDHVFRIAVEDKLEDELRQACQCIVIASVGPVCSEVIEHFGLKADLEPPHPKMGSLIAELAVFAGQILARKRSP